MEEYIQVSAKTKEEAITNACIKLGLSSDQLEIVVVSEGSAGFLGIIGSKPAVIKARKKPEVPAAQDILDAVQVQPEKPARREKTEKPEQKPYRQPEKKEAAKQEPKKEPVKREAPKKEREFSKKEYPAKERPGRPAEILTDPQEIAQAEESARQFLTDVFAAMQLPVEICVKYNPADGTLEANFEGEDMGILIGKRGQTLDSLQYLVSLVVNKKRSSYLRVKLDTEDYRHRRKETLENLAKGIAYKVRKTRRPVILEPMNPYERRIIHSALQGNKFVETTSEGEEPFRHVVVKLKERSKP